jgi:hypothetical protein
MDLSRVKEQDAPDTLPAPNPSSAKAPEINPPLLDTKLTPLALDSWKPVRYTFAVPPQPLAGPKKIAYATASTRTYVCLLKVVRHPPRCLMGLTEIRRPA